ncbi:MAG: ATP-binding protein [Phaeodactylibacter sp.]|nr:ATP-binding protein [Phaeodactylibacter sp.]
MKNENLNNTIQYDNILEQEIERVGGIMEPPANDGRVGVTMFDVSGSEDNLVSVVVPKERLRDLPAQALVRIGASNEGDGRIYQGIVVKGPFFEPDGIRGDSAVIVTTAANGMMFMPKYHGRVMVELLGEIINGIMETPRFRPLPNSPVFPLSSEESRLTLNLTGEIVLGRAIGHENMMVKVPSQKKSVLPRHIGILGTTGGGKSTTVSGMVNHFQKNGIATILIDTEGEYTHIDHPSENPTMLKILERRGISPEGVKNTKILKLVGDETTNPGHPHVENFTLSFEHLSPYSVMEILGFNDAQQQRFLKAYDIARSVLRRLKIFPANESEKKLEYDLDEFERGYYKLDLRLLYDVIAACQKKAAKEELIDGENLTFPSQWIKHKTKEEQNKFRSFFKDADFKSDNVASWRAVQGQFGLWIRLKIFDNPTAKPFNFEELTTPGTVTILDLSDTKSTKIRNLVIAELLKGLMDVQDKHNGKKSTTESDIRKVMVVIEEAHEFLSNQRIDKMRNLYEQVASIAKRGRKRWLGLTFVTQLPQHLPDDVLALLNNFILHKISDANVISRLKRTVGGVDESLWNKAKNLSAGQAIVKFNHMNRGMLTAIDPTPCKLLMED